jgi:hypothetical protein
MKKSQVYFIHKYQTQYYDYNTNKKGKDFLSKIYFFILFFNNKCSVI